MADKKKAAPVTTISHCKFTVLPPAVNEQTRAAVEALAKAAEANAFAIQQAARALQGGAVEAAIKVGN